MINRTFNQMLGLEYALPGTYYGANPPVPYCDACRAGLYPQSATCSCARCLAAHHVGALPPASTESTQAQVSGQLSTRMLVIGVLAALAAGAVIYEARKR